MPLFFFFTLHATSHDNVLFNLSTVIQENNQTKKQYTDSDDVKSDLESPTLYTIYTLL